MPRNNVFAVAAGLMCVMVGLPALAQIDGDEEPTVDREALPDILITAQRRQTGLQDTPVTVTALSERQLQQRVVVQTLGLGRQVPNLVASNNITLGGSNAYYLRGIGSQESLASFDPPVITYVDEVVDPRQIANNVMLLDIERLEVLRGPQGTLFGRNTTGGAISIITRKPGPEFEAKGELSYGRFDEVTARAGLNVPLADGVYGRVAAFFSDYDGWQRSVRTDELYNGNKSYGVRGALRIEPSDTVTWDIAGDWQFQRRQTLQSIVDPVAAETNVSGGDDGPWALGSGDLNDVYLSNCTDGETPFEWIRNGCTASEVEGFNIYSNLAVDFAEAATLNLISGYRDHDHRFVSPLNASLRGGFELPLSTQGRSKMMQQELKLSGVLLDSRLTYVTGLFYLTEDNFTDFETALSTPELGVFLVIDRNMMENDSRSFAWYGQGEYALTENLTFTAGLRWTREKKTIPFYEHTNDAGVNFDIDDIVALGTPDRVVTRQWTPRFIVQYDFDVDVMVYASATRGFKSGGWNGRAGQARLMTFFEKETAWSYELGSRAEWFDRRLRTNVTLFHVTYNDLQLPSLAFVPMPGEIPQFITSNAGKLRVRGAEIELSAVLSPGLTVYANLGLQDGNYKSIGESAAAAGILIDNRPQRTPDVTALIGGEYRSFVNTLAGEVYANADVQITSSYFIDAQNTPSALNPGHTTVNASIGYERDGGAWALQLSCKNCFDKRYFTDQLLGARFLNDPMRWLVTLRFRYN